MKVALLMGWLMICGVYVWVVLAMGRKERKAMDKLNRKFEDYFEGKIRRDKS